MKTLKDSMNRRIVVVAPDDSIKRAVRLMASKNIGCVVSVEMNKPVGILTERDIVRIIHKGMDTDKTKVKDVMSKKLISLDSGKSIQEAVDILEKKHIKKLPIIESGKLIGIVTITDLLKSLRELENEESKKLKKTVKDLHLTKIKLQSRIISLEDKLVKR
jgi:predicted transcriptional regulator